MAHRIFESQSLDLLNITKSLGLLERPVLVCQAVNLATAANVRFPPNLAPVKSIISFDTVPPDVPRPVRVMRDACESEVEFGLIRWKDWTIGIDAAIGHNASLSAGSGVVNVARAVPKETPQTSIVLRELSGQNQAKPVRTHWVQQDTVRRLQTRCKGCGDH